MPTMQNKETTKQTDDIQIFFKKIINKEKKKKKKGQLPLRSI
jgi:hypothetical protein